MLRAISWRNLGPKHRLRSSPEGSRDIPRGANATDPLIELVEPAGPDSPVSRFLRGRGGLHHLCYEVDDLEAHLAFCKSIGTIVIRPPVPAVAFGGRRIAWALTRKRLLVEFLESREIPSRIDTPPGAPT